MDPELERLLGIVSRPTFPHTSAERVNQKDMALDSIKEILTSQRISESRPETALRSAELAEMQAGIISDPLVADILSEMLDTQHNRGALQQLVSNRMGQETLDFAGVMGSPYRYTRENSPGTIPASTIERESFGSFLAGYPSTIFGNRHRAAQAMREERNAANELRASERLAAREAEQQFREDNLRRRGEIQRAELAESIGRGIAGPFGGLLANLLYR